MLVTSPVFSHVYELHLKCLGLSIYNLTISPAPHLGVLVIARAKQR